MVFSKTDKRCGFTDSRNTTNSGKVYTEKITLGHIIVKLLKTEDRISKGRQRKTLYSQK